jgi:small subunit ribosomal protein S27e
MEKPQEKSKFLKIRCPGCKKTHMTFGKASTWVKCGNCNKLLTRPKGGKAKIKAIIKKII